MISDDYSVVPQMINNIHPSLEKSQNRENDFFSDCSFWYPRDHILTCGSNLKLFDFEKNSTLWERPLPSPYANVLEQYGDENLFIVG